MSFLKNHPFGVEAFFERSLVLSFAIPYQELLPLIPNCLELEIYDNKWAFIAVATVQTKDLRPQGFPTMLGNDFFLVGYRIFVKYMNERDKRLRGLYILKSETDKKRMAFLGNIFTHYNYTTTDIEQTQNGNFIEIKSKKSNLKIVVEKNIEGFPLPPNSPFTDWADARRFSGPLPFTFTYDKLKKEVVIIEGMRQNWKPEPVKIIDYNIPYFKEMGIKEAILANAFIVENVKYMWKKGKIEKWG
jgi:uncharacterized protein YqjF (DUF2071 family)